MKSIIAIGALLCSALVAAGQNQAVVRLSDLTHPEVKARDVQVVILPIGSTEPHANHLPYCTDTLTVEILAERVAAKANEMGAHVLVLPALPYGVNSNQVGNSYAQSIRPATMMQFVKDIVDTLGQQGIRKVVILNGHGGNTSTLGAALREMFASHPKVFAAMVETWTPYQDKLKEIIETGGDHSSEEETSVALSLFPARVHMDRAVKAREAPLKMSTLDASYINFMRPWKYISDNTGLGDPTKATAAKGQRLVDIVVTRLSLFLKELSDAQITDRFPY